MIYNFRFRRTSYQAENTGGPTEVSFSHDINLTEEQKLKLSAYAIKILLHNNLTGNPLREIPIQEVLDRINSFCNAVHPNGDFKTKIEREKS